VGLVTEYLRKLTRAGIGVTFLSESSARSSTGEGEPVISFVMKAKDEADDRPHTVHEVQNFG
jgi:hypothetical protein